MSNKPIAIAVSGKSGCGNTTTSALLAHRLGLQLVNYTFRNLAVDKGFDFDELCKMAETDDRWDRLVDERQVAMANAHPSVLASRLAIWVWHNAEIKVYLDAPLEVRAERVHKREHGNLQEKRDTTRRRDEADHERYLRLYGINNNDWSFADLVVDVSARSPEEIVETILDFVDNRP